MEENKEGTVSIIPVGNNQLSKVANTIIITNKIIAEFDKRNNFPEQKESWVMFRNNIANNGISNNTPPEFGKLKWKFKTEGFIWDSPLIKNDALFFGSEDGNFYSISANGGDLIWKTKTDGKPTGNAIIYDDIIIFCSKKLYVVNIKSGIQEWALNVKGCSIKLISKNNFFITDQIGSQDFIKSINIDSQKVNWEIPLGDEGGILSNFSSNNEILFVSIDFVFGQPAILIAIDIVTGKMLWQFNAESISSSSTTIVQDVVYFACNEFIYSIDIKTGKLNQKFSIPFRKVPHQHAGSRYSFIVKDKKLYFVKEGYLLCLNTENSKVETKFKTTGKLTAPILIDDIIYFGSTNGNLYAVNFETGIEDWKYMAGKRIFSSPSIAHGSLYFGCEDGYLYAIE